MTLIERLEILLEWFEPKVILIATIAGTFASVFTAVSIVVEKGLNILRGNEHD